MKSIFALALLASTVANATEDNPVLGEFNWSPTGAVCPETYVYRADGTKIGTSAGEVLEKTYTISKAKGGMYLLEETVTAGNGGKDCQGGTTPVGAASKIYIMPLNGGGYFTCANLDTLSCYGVASPVKPAAKP
ncbi:MAG: hypothetical protein KA218_02850 [Arenimonas sp.]|nr:hypothetical protein [Arenimonas sp.]MBP7981525.1 hypothetical protein [Arenimonas sp.]